MGMQDVQTLWDRVRGSGVSERPSAPPPWLIDDLIAERYRIVARLGSGAMGVVFRAEDLVLGRPVALKLLTRSRFDVVALACFRKEACALAQVRHDNVVRIYSLGEHRGAPYLAMQFVEGQDLGSIIREHAKRGETVPRERALQILNRIANGLDAVHAQSLVHRDVKPRNIVIEKRGGRPVLVDFGHVRRHSVSTPNLSAIGGTPCYMPPEQANDASGARVSARSDVYALACTAFELLTGHARNPAPRISSLRADLAPFDDVFIRALANSPEERHPSCNDFVDELEEAARRIEMPIPAPIAPKDSARVLVLLAGDDVRARILGTMGRALHTFGGGLTMECVQSDLAFARAFARSPADIVVIDDELAGGRTDALVEGLRHAPGGGHAEVLILGGSRSAARLEELGARELPKPLNTHVLGLAVARMGTRIAERRERSTRNAGGSW